MGIIVLIASATLLYNFYYPYSTGNQFMNEGTFFEKMQFINTDFPAKLMEFMNTNNISGNAFCPWIWEGFIRLECPQIKIYAGARAQQVYDEKTNENYLDLSSENPSIELLKQDNVHMLILPLNDGSFPNLIKKILKEGNWIAIYADTKDILLADSQYSGNRTLIEKALKSQLAFNDENSRALAPYALMLGTYSGISQEEKINKFPNLSDNYICPWIYYDLSEILVGDKKELSEKIEQIYIEELDKFTKISGKTSNGKKIFFPLKYCLL